MAPKSKAITKANGTALAKAQPLEDWEIELQHKAQDAAAAETVGIPRITHKSGILKIDDKAVDGNKLPHAILCYGLAKTYFRDGYDPKASKGDTPVCYSFAKPLPGEEAKMAPHAAAPDKQNTDCATCPHNAFGTAEKGDGKRCRDIRRVLVIAPGSNDPEDVLKAQVRQYEVPPGSLRNWGTYLKSLKEIHPTGAPQFVITTLGTQPNEDAGAYTLTFTPTEVLEKPFVKALIEKGKAVESDLFAPFPATTKKEESKPDPKKNAKRSKKVG